MMTISIILNNIIIIIINIITIPAAMEASIPFGRDH